MYESNEKSFPERAQLASSGDLSMENALLLLTYLQPRIPIQNPNHEVAGLLASQPQG